MPLMQELATDQRPGHSGDQAWQELKALLGERIEQGLAGQLSRKSIADVIDEELGPDQHS